MAQQIGCKEREGSNFTHVPKLVLEEDEKEMDLNNLCVYSHHQFAYACSGHMHLNQQQFLHYAGKKKRVSRKQLKKRITYYHKTESLESNHSFFAIRNICVAENKIKNKKSFYWKPYRVKAILQLRNILSACPFSIFSTEKET